MFENGSARMMIVLVGNKIDDEANRQVSWEEGQLFAKKNDLIFFETSAKTGENVDNIYLASAKAVFQNIMNNSYDLSDEQVGIKPGNAPAQFKKKANPFQKSSQALGTNNSYLNNGD